MHGGMYRAPPRIFEDMRVFQGDCGHSCGPPAWWNWVALAINGPEILGGMDPQTLDVMVDLLRLRLGVWTLVTVPEQRAADVGQCSSSQSGKATSCSDGHGVEKPRLSLTHGCEIRGVCSTIQS